MQAGANVDVNPGRVLPLLKRVDVEKFPQSQNAKDMAMSVFTGGGTHHGYIVPALTPEERYTDTTLERRTGSIWR